AAGAVGQRRVEGDEVAAAEDVVELDLLDADLERALGAEEGIIGDDFHAKPERPVGDDRADIAAADDAERLVEELDAHEAVLLPLAGMRRGVGFGNLAGERHHQRQRMLGGGDGVAERGVHDDDAARRGGRDVDIVDADAGAADHFQVLRLGDELGRDLGRRADGKPVIGGDARGECILVLAEIGLVGDLDAPVAEDLHGGFGELVGDEYAWRHWMRSLVTPSPLAGEGGVTRSGAPGEGNAAPTPHPRSRCSRTLSRKGRGEMLRYCPWAQSSHGVSALRSAVSTVAPHQMRSPGGASRWAPMSKATPSPSRSLAIFFAGSAPPSTVRQTEVLDRVF